MERAAQFVRYKWNQLQLFLADIRHIPATLIRMRRNGTVPYVLYGATYNPKSAGCIACHRLVHDLNEAGFDAFSVHRVNPSWNEHQLSRFGSFLLVKFANPVALYPEIVSGNPLGARRVVRWVLNFPGRMGGDLEYDDCELVYTWSADYYDTDRILSLNLTDRTLFNVENLPPKDVDCFYIGKGPMRGANPIPFTDGMTEITYEWPAERHQLAELLRRTRDLYTYDDNTAMVREALLCGCRVILLPEHREFPAEEVTGFFEQDHDTQFQKFIDETQSHWFTRG